MTTSIDLPADPAEALDLGALPAKPGVFVFENESGETLALAVTANLRRMVHSKLEPIESAGGRGRTRRVPYRTLVRTVRAASVGSAFEADWTYLQLARMRLPSTYRAMLDRWQAWFIHVDPGAPFPQWLKTAHPRIVDADGSRSGANLGPFPDKHAAGRYIELLQDAFDLCRYHHILVQAPHATACAYKEMGRCPAPCDGSVSMDSYRARMLEVVEFACSPIAHWRSQVEQRMRVASNELDFERAQRDRKLLERTAPAQRVEYAHVNLLQRFEYLAVMPGGRRGWARLFAILGGWIEPILDLPIDRPHDASARDQIVALVHEFTAQRSADFSDAGIENIGMVCAHLLRPRRAKHAEEFIRLTDLTEARLDQALRRLGQDAMASAEEPPEIVDRDTENIALPEP